MLGDCLTWLTGLCEVTIIVLPETAFIASHVLHEKVLQIICYDCDGFDCQDQQKAD